MRSSVPPATSERRDSWLHTAETFVLCLLYVTAFWGQAARVLPAPFDQWSSLPYRAAGPWWHTHVATGLGHREQLALYELVEALLFAVLLPIWILRRKGYRTGNVGVRAPSKAAARLVVASVFLSLPFGFYLGHVVTNPWGTPLQEGLGLLTVVPEHFLIFGAIGALLLPGGHAGAGGNLRRVGVEEALAITGTAFIFFLVHVGTSHASVLFTSFPLGLIFAYVTVRTMSIWPAIGAHWLLNLVPMALGIPAT